jgi:hypothetical protein
MAMASDGGMICSKKCRIAWAFANSSAVLEEIGNTRCSAG